MLALVPQLQLALFNVPKPLPDHFPDPYISLPTNDTDTSGDPCSSPESSGVTTIGRATILIAISSSCTCLVQKQKQHSCQNSSKTYSFVPDSSCPFCSLVIKWVKRLISMEMLKIKPYRDDCNIQMWTVENIGKNDKVVYVDGKELKKGLDNVVKIGIGSEVLFWNWKEGERFQKNEKNQEDCDVIVFRVDDLTKTEYTKMSALERGECKGIQDEIVKSNSIPPVGTHTSRSSNDRMMGGRSEKIVCDKSQSIFGEVMPNNGVDSRIEPIIHPIGLPVTLEKAKLVNGTLRNHHQNANEEEKESEHSIREEQELSKAQLEPSPIIDLNSINNDGSMIDTMPMQEHRKSQYGQLAHNIMNVNQENRSTPRKYTHCTPDEKVINSQDQGVIDLISLESKPSSLSASSVPAAPVIDLVSDESQLCSSSTQVSNEIDSKAQSKDEIPEIQSAVYFLKRGRSMPQKRIEIFTEKLNINDPDLTILSKFDQMNPPRYIVLDCSLSVESVSIGLGLKNTTEMAKILEGVYLVKPEWAEKYLALGIGLQERKPTMDQCWSGTSIMQKKRKATNEAEENSPLDNGWIKRLRKTHEFAPVVKKPASRSNNELVSRMYRGNCADKGNVSTRNQQRNLDLSKMLEIISKLYKECPLDRLDSWRSYTYNIASTRLKYLDFDVIDDPSSLQKLSKIKGFGKKSMTHVIQFLHTGTCELIKAFEHDEQRLAIRNMTKIWGVGPAMAAKLVGSGYKTIGRVRRALEANELNLSKGARVGVEFYNEFQEKMSRREVEMIHKLVTKATRKYFPDAEILLMGSYRRGKLQCGDADILITHKKYTETVPSGALDEIVERLKNTGKISHHLTEVETRFFRDMPSQSEDVHLPSTFLPYVGSQMYMGVFNSPMIRGKHRRIDIKFYPYEEKVYSMLYFTGNGYFNRSIRLYVQRCKGGKLNDHGFFLNRAGTGKRVKVKTEKEVFDKLGLVYKDPNERDGFDAVIEKKTSEVFLVHGDLTSAEVAAEENIARQAKWVD